MNTEMTYQQKQNYIEDLLSELGITYSIECLGFFTHTHPDNRNWLHDRFDVYVGDDESFSYSQGSGHYGKEPRIADVLYSLVSSVSTAEDNETVEDFQSSFGYDNWYEASYVFNACKEEAEKVKRIFTIEQIEQLKTIFEDY